jgi:hypothetical protein
VVAVLVVVALPHQVEVLVAERLMGLLVLLGQRDKETAVV